MLNREQRRHPAQSGNASQRQTTIVAQKTFSGPMPAPEDMLRYKECLKKNDGMKPKDLKLAEAIVEENKENFEKEWAKFFGKGS